MPSEEPKHPPDKMSPYDQNRMSPSSLRTQYREQDRDRGRDRARDRTDFHQNPPNFYRSRHAEPRDHSRSPQPRIELSYDDAPAPEDDTRYPRRQDYSGSRGDPEEGEVTGQDRYSRDSRGRGPRSYDHPLERDQGSSYRGNSRRQYDTYGDGSSYLERPRRSSRSHSRSPHARRSRSRSWSPPRNPGPPSDTIILEGLSPNASLSELHADLSHSTMLPRLSPVDIRISNSRGSRRAFIQFRDADEALAFMDENFPSVYIRSSRDGEGSDERRRIYIHFARNRDEGDASQGRGGQWTCPSCDYPNYSTRSLCKICGFSQPDDSQSYRQMLTGESDVGDSQSHILVFYPLSASVTEEVLAFGAKKLEIVPKQLPSRESSSGTPKLKSTAPTGDAAGYGARPGSLHRVFLIRDQETNKSLNYGFAEFWTIEDAMSAMVKFRMSKSYMVGGSPTTVSPIHLGVFVHSDNPRDDKTSFSPLFNPTLRVQYWDPHVYPSAQIITTEPPRVEKDGERDDENVTNDGKKFKKRKAEVSLSGSTAKKPVAMAPQMAMWQKKHVEIHTDGKPSDSSTEPSGVSEAPQKGSAIKISLASATRLAAGGDAQTHDVGAAQGAEGLSTPTQKTSPEVPVSYVDREKVCCLLCMMKYKSLDDLNTHERSRNHKTAMEDEAKVQASLPRLAARDRRLQKKAEEEAQTEAAPQYRDRAKERRDVFGHHQQPKAQQPRKAPNETKPAPTPAAAPKSKGLAMLAKMGWSEGEGLGAQGEGRTEIIPVHAYQEGVGLGVEGGNLGDAQEVAEKRTRNGYAEYVNTVQDKARERYTRLNEKEG